MDRLEVPGGRLLWTCGLEVRGDFDCSGGSSSSISSNGQGNWGTGNGQGNGYGNWGTGNGQGNGNGNGNWQGNGQGNSNGEDRHYRLPALLVWR